MDPVTGALLGASIGVIGALGGALLNPYTAARHARRSKIMEMRRDAYVAAIASLESVASAQTIEHLELAARALNVPTAQLLLFADQDTTSAFADLRDQLWVIRDHLHRLDAESVSAGRADEGTRRAMDKFEDQMHVFIDVARSELGIDGRRARAVLWWRRGRDKS